MLGPLPARAQFTASRAAAYTAERSLPSTRKCGMSSPLVYSEMYFVGTVSAIGTPMSWKLFSLTNTTGTFRLVQLANGAEVVRRRRAAVPKERDGDLLGAAHLGAQRRA